MDVYWGSLRTNATLIQAVESRRSIFSIFQHWHSRKSEIRRRRLQDSFEKSQVIVWKEGDGTMNAVEVRHANFSALTCFLSQPKIRNLTSSKDSKPSEV
jgi:hypothetical protein